MNKPASAQIVAAILDARSQDMAPRTPDELIVSVVQGGKAFIARSRRKRGWGRSWTSPIRSKEAKSKSDKAQADYAASGRKNERLLDDSIRLEEKEDRDFRKCFGERAKREVFFATVTKQAQSLVDRLTSR